MIGKNLSKNLNMKIIVTGAGGFIAQNILRHLSNFKNIRIKAFFKKNKSL